MTHYNRRQILAGTGATLTVAAAAPVTGVTSSAALPSLRGKTFLITGTSSGFGYLGALLYARQGARVFATMRNLPRSEGEELERIAHAEKLDLTVLALDVLSDEQVKATVAEVERRNNGPIDVLVNNAGIVISGPVELHDMEATKLAFDTNVFGYQRLARAVLPGMRAKRSGLIVNVSSQQGRIIMPGMGLYSATKFAVESMSEQLAYEVALHGIEVVIIQPGGYPTKVGANRARYNAELVARAEEKHKAGYPEMVVGMSSRTSGRSVSASMPAGMPDPAEVPRAIAEIVAMSPGTRPLRRPVHPAPKPQEAINKVSTETQLALLGNGPYAASAQAVLD